MLPQNEEQLGERLSAYLDGELGPEETAEVERILATEPQVREMLERLRRTVEAVHTLPRQSAPEGLLDELAVRIERAHQLNKFAEPGGAVRGHRRSTWGLVASAAV
ncbi:MAG: zf-HC2 domain-containing protein, partial [Planctomycetota bacterium]